MSQQLEEKMQTCFQLLQFNMSRMTDIAFKDPVIPILKFLFCIPESSETALHH